MAYLSPQTVSYLLSESLPSSGIPEGPVSRRDQIIAGMGGMGGGGMGTLQALLSEMSGLKKPRGFFNRILRRVLGMRPKPPPKYRILHIFATNMPQSLDEAMLRPGRIDRIYKVGYPSKEGRKETFRYYLAKVKHELTEDEVERLAVISPYSTGATIQDMVNEALVIAVRDGRESIQWRDILRAKQLKEHGLPDDTEYIERERHAVAIHEAAHAVVSYRLRKHAVIDVATIERRGEIGGFVSFIPPEDQFTHWKTEYEVDVMGSIASLAGERMFFESDNSSGVGGDLRNATAVATLMEAFYAMGSTIGSHGVTKFGITQGRGQMTAEDGTDRNLLETELGRRVEVRLEQLYERTWKLLEENRQEVLAVAHALETHKTIAGDDVAAIIDGTKGPLVDGRAYAQQEFRDLAEAYHSQAVTAHRSHARVAIQLPAVTLVAEPEASGNGSNPHSLPSGNGEAPAGAAARPPGRPDLDGESEEPEPERA
jgi:hypothetical protein